MLVLFYGVFYGKFCSCQKRMWAWRVAILESSIENTKDNTLVPHKISSAFIFYDLQSDVRLNSRLHSKKSISGFVLITSVP
jgi:hypothetical protein